MSENQEKRKTTWIEITILVLCAVAVAALIFIIVGCDNPLATKPEAEVVVESDNKKQVRVMSNGETTVIAIEKQVALK